ncbi:MAG TPA: TRAM domain-containing protein [Candidatus Microbacterium stercoravium]|uniref:TRAM domain-containing protein n=1 Tax=Candidatus Microbacterium stercoravium TaxID=2838697 RepID=A0A9D2H776_9MICO|nr:TRAM domain-containing protein [Candidatus Microbacterium stercoravium]
MQTGDIAELEISGVAHGGVFIARHGEAGFVVFVPDVLPGERVLARITQVKKSFARAEVLEVLDASPHRVPHIWRQASIDRPPELRPGGADFGHIELGHQRELKTRVLTEAFDRFAGGSVRTAVEAVPGDERGVRWRTRVGLHVDGSGRVGPFAARSHDVIDVADHPLATVGIERVALGLGREKPGRIDLVQPADGEVRVLRRPDDRRRGRGPRPAPEVVIERVAEREFRVDADGFWQVHHGAAAALDRAVREALAGIEPDDDAHHLDLYGGVGLFAAALAERGGRVTTVESSPRATQHARDNLADLGVEAVTARVERFVEQLPADPALAGGVTLLDPPRAGAGEQVVTRIADLGPRAVVYVACDPVALARDVGIFRRLGYDLDAVRGIDLFPGSHHVEAVAVLRR